MIVRRWYWAGKHLTVSNFSSVSCAFYASNLSLKSLTMRSDSTGYDIEASNTLPVKPSTAIPPATAVNPEAPAGNGNNSDNSGASPTMTNQSPWMKTLSYALTIALIPFLQ